jgi:hypothetical protein
MWPVSEAARHDELARCVKDAGPDASTVDDEPDDTSVVGAPSARPCDMGVDAGDKPPIFEGRTGESTCDLKRPQRPLGGDAGYGYPRRGELDTAREILSP